LDNWIYISIASRNASRADMPSSLGEELRSTMIASNTFKKAYQTGLSIAGIRTPSIGYRKAVDRVRAEGAVQIRDKQNPDAEIVVVQIKKI
jgi:hypothetical protein